MEFAKLLEQLGQTTGISDIALDAQGSCTLNFDGEYDVTFTVDTEDASVMFHCEVAPYTQNDAECFRTLLSASLLGAKTDGGAFALHEAVGKIVLWKRHGEFVDYPALEKAINRFLAQIVFWKQQLSGPRESTAKAAEATGLPDFALSI